MSSEVLKTETSNDQPKKGDNEEGNL